MAQIPHKLAHDLYYLNNLGLLLDLRILAATAFHVIGAGCVCFSKLLVSRESPQTAAEMMARTAEAQAERPSPMELAYVELASAA